MHIVWKFYIVKLDIPLSFLQWIHDVCITLEDCSPNCLTIAKESSMLCTILPLINHNQYIESVLNPSSQVITMSEAACHALALIYNPRIHLHMQSAIVK